MTVRPRCKICDHSGLEEVEEYSKLHRVTSDSKPWAPGGQLTYCTNCAAVQKLPSAKWNAEIDAIYGVYELDHQAGGAEQRIFSADGGASAARSVRIIDHATDILGLPDTGRMLDFGCGNGGALASFSARHPGWTLFGAELSERSLQVLQEIPRFAGLYTCAPGEIGRAFDLVMLIHSLEHMVDPIATLADLRSSMGLQGHILVEVPDCMTTPYDLLVADHLLHFSLPTLKAAGERAGYETVAISDSVLIKELTWIGRVGAEQEDAGASDSAENLESRGETVRCQVAWLSEQVDAARAIADGSHAFGIFGTSISATWLQGSLGDAAAFFVDEDPGRIGREHMGRPIFAPGGVPQGADVFVPLIPDVARSVCDRLGGQAASYHVPPLLRMTNGGAQ